MSDYIKTIIKIYVFILIMVYILLGKINLDYLNCIILILNSTIGICGFLVNTSYFDFNKESVYKYLSFIFAFTGIINLIYGFSRLIYLNSFIYYINIYRYIGLLAIIVEVILFIYLINYKKEEYNVSKHIGKAVCFVIISLYIICRTNLLPKLHNFKGVTIYAFIIEIICILGVLYIIKNLNRLSNKISKRTMRDLQIYNIARLIHLLCICISCILIKYFNFIDIEKSIITLVVSVVYSICITRICYMDIIRRPNQMLYRNLLREKEKLEQTNKAYKDYKKRYEEVLMYLPDGVLVSENGVIVFANEKINQYFDLSDSSDILGRTIENIVDKSELECIKNIDDFERPIKYFNLKYCFNNVEFYGEQTTIIKKKKNKILNISIIKNMEDKIKLDKIKQELEYNKTMDEIKNQVLANISHDFKTPINVIYSTVQMQDLNIKNNKTDNLLDFNKIIKQNCNRLIRLINNFIDSIRLESNIIIPQLKHVNIVSLIEDITMSVLNYAQEKDIELVFDTEQEEVYSSVDVDFMEKIMLNLLSNAIKYNKENGSISVMVKDTDQLIIISIKDTGIGIPKNKLKNIFERFERVENTTTKTQEGSGIGLSIVKQMVESLNGAVDINSIEGKGTVVKVILQKSEVDENEIEEIDLEYIDSKASLELSDI